MLGFEEEEETPRSTGESDETKKSKKTIRQNHLKKIHRSKTGMKELVNQFVPQKTQLLVNQGCLYYNCLVNQT